MNEIGIRLKGLRESVHYSQAKMAELIGTNQTSLARIENGQTAPSLRILLWYADYFDVSMDYIFCRTDKPQGKLYEYKPKLPASNEEMQQFISMCFDPKSPMSDKLKQALLDLMKGDTQ